MSGHIIKELAASQHMDCRDMNDSDITSNRLFVITHQVNAYEKV